MKKMRIALVFMFVSLFIGAATFGQSVFISTETGGLWNQAATWNCVDGPCATMVPTASDIAVIAPSPGNFVTVNGSFTIKDLYVINNVAGAVRKSGFGAANLTVNGQLQGADPSLDGTPLAPEVNVFHSSTSTLNFIFTGSNLNDPVAGAAIANWGHETPLNSVTLNPGSGNTIRVDAFMANSSVTAASGTIQLNNSQDIRNGTGALSIVVNDGAILNCLGVIGTPSTRIGTFTNNGIVNTGSDAYINSTTFNLGATGVLNVSFAGVNQTQGWWYQENAPTTFSINTASTINFNANTSQNFFAATYGNLSLFSNSTTTKTLVGPGNLVVNGNFSVPSSDVTVASSNTNPRTFLGNLTMSGTWNATQLVVFEGGASQGISGSGILSFNGGLEVDKSSGTLTLNKNISVTNGLTITNGTLALGATTLSISGAMVNNGTLSAGSSTISTSGSTSFSGASITTPYNLTIASGTFTAPAGTLNITGNLTNNGIYAANNGTISFSGPAQQNVSGNDCNFRNLTVNNPFIVPGVSMESNQSILGTLTLAANTRLDPDGSADNNVLTLVSSSDDPTTDGMIAAIPSTSIIDGPVTVQRFMSIEGPNNGRIYRYVSSPVQNATVADFQNEIPVTGSFTGSSTCSGCSTSQSMFLYNQTVPGTFDLGYEDFPVNTNSETFASGRGYAVFVRGDILGTARWNLTGRVNNGNVSLPVSYTVSTPTALPEQDGFNLVGNPYPSTINWSSGSWVKSNIDDAIYMRDNATGNIASFVGGVSINGGTQYIAIGQGFWVKANAASPVLTATENVKAAGQQTTFFREESIQDLLRITMRQGDFRDETVVRFKEDATNSFDASYDAYKLKGANFNLFSLTGNTELSVSSLEPYTCGTSVALGLEASVGTYSLEFTEFESFQTSIKIYLHDNYLDKTVSITESSVYQFEVNAEADSQGNERFSLSFDSAPLLNIPVVADDVCGGNAIVSLTFSEENTSYQLFVGDQSITDNISGTGDQLEIEINGSHLVEGSNEIMIKASAICGSFDFNEPVIITKASIVAVEDVSMINQICLQGTASLMVSGGGVNDSYNWYESEVGGTPVFQSESNTFETEVLDKSKTYFVTIINELGCESNRVPVEAKVNLYDEVTIEKNGNELISSYAEGNQWYIGEEAIEGATSREFTPAESGVYAVEVNVAGCISREEYDFIITDIEQNFAEEWSYYPNPVSDQLILKTSGQINQIQKIGVSNALGMEVGQITLNPEGVGYFDMKAMPTGIYVVKILGFGKSVNFKIIKR